jgi:hypothetical protein
MTDKVFKPEESRVIARYQRALTEACDRELRYAALADSLADQVVMLQGELQRCKAEAAARAALPGVPVVESTE